MRQRVKICCIQSVAEAEMAIAAGASLLGLVGAMPSGPGPISDETIAEICAWAPPGVKTVLLSSETTAEGLTAHVAAAAHRSSRSWMTLNQAPTPRFARPTRR